MFVYELSGCGFESSCSHLNFRFYSSYKFRLKLKNLNYSFPKVVICIWIFCFDCNTYELLTHIPWRSSSCNRFMNGHIIWTMVKIHDQICLRVTNDFLLMHLLFHISSNFYIWDKVFKNGPSKICRRQPLKNLKGYGLPNFTWSILEYFYICIYLMQFFPS